VEGGSGRVAASSGAVLHLEADAREGTAGAASERRRKHGAGRKIPPVAAAAPFERGGGRWGRSGGGRESRVMRGGREEGFPGSHRHLQLGWRGTTAARVSAQWRAALGR
jgi:hypothetical protein